MRFNSTTLLFERVELHLQVYRVAPMALLDCDDLGTSEDADSDTICSTASSIHKSVVAGLVNASVGGPRKAKFAHDSWLTMDN